jgi:ABC-2 type transport system permease protein
MIRTTLAADARRVVTAKAGVVTATALATGALSVLGSLILGRIILSDKGFLVASLGEGPTVRAYAGTVLYFGLIGLLSLGIGLIIRHTGGAITVVLGVLFTLPILASLVTDPVWRERLLRLAPMTAGLAIQATTNLDTLPILPWQGLGLLAGYAATAMLTGAFLFQKRDA